MRRSTSTREAAVERTVVALFVCLAILQFAVQCGLLGHGVDYIASLITNDDTYYYLQTAWQTKQSGFVTFDGVNSTNGVQLFWFGIVFLLSLAAKTKVGLLLASLVTCFALNVLCYVPILRFVRLIGRPALAVLIGGLWAKLVTDGTYWLGLENSLHALVFWCVVWQAAAFLHRLSKGLPARLLPLTVLLVLNAWTRIDAAAFSGVIYVVCVGALVWSRRKAHGPESRAARQIGASAAVAAWGLAVALGAFHLIGGSVLPVSAMVKLSGPSGGGALLETVRGMFVLSLPALLPHGIASPGLMTALGLVSVGIVLVALALRRFDSRDTRVFRTVWVTLAAGLLFYLSAAGLSGAQSHSYFVWHRTPLYVFWVLTVGAAVWFVLSTVAGVLSRRSVMVSRGERTAAHVPLARGAGLAAAAIGLSLMIFSVVRMFAPPRVDPTSMLAIRYRAAMWMGENLPSDATCAAWNAGQLGFYAPQTVINLDGLVNSVEYYEDVLRGKRSLDDYLAEVDVGYIVDYMDNELTAGLETVHSFPAEADGRVLRVRRVPGERRRPGSHSAD